MADEVFVANKPMARVIKRAARQRGVSPEKLVTRSILLLKYLSERSASGDTIVVRDVKTGVATTLTLSA